MADLFMSSHVRHTEDGATLLRHAMRCRWCFAPTTGQDDRENDPIDWLHEPPCRVRDLIERWKLEGNSAAVVDEYDAIIDLVENADRQQPS